MRTFQESKKSQKTVESLKIDKNDKIKQENCKTSKKGGAKNKAQEVIEEGMKIILYHIVLQAHSCHKPFQWLFFLYLIS